MHDCNLEREDVAKCWDSFLLTFSQVLIIRQTLWVKLYLQVRKVNFWERSNFLRFTAAQWHIQGLKPDFKTSSVYHLF